MDGMRAKPEVSVTMKPVIVRACVCCGGKRELALPCTTCGNPEPPVVHDLGIQSAHYGDPLKQLLWLNVGQRRAARRARQVNEEMNGG